MRRVTKALVKHGTRLPKELRLFMKDFMFIEGAIATLAPDLDVLGEMLNISQYFVRQHGAQILSEIGLDPGALELDPTSWAASMGVDESRQSLTHEENNSVERCGPLCQLTGVVAEANRSPDREPTSGAAASSK
jgi:ubiquinone biosynthesis protein